MSEPWCHLSCNTILLVDAPVGSVSVDVDQREL